jgi:alkanesulfonate monooxygenase SsuD/methylene tetrahydromethanopterin reductase-like flavin-dependent oxidoreductase (luciferase family)
MFSLRFDRGAVLRRPGRQALPSRPEHLRLAEDHGCLAAVVCEHHASPDGYPPTPLILASAIAARTRSLA